MSIKSIVLFLASAGTSAFATAAFRVTLREKITLQNGFRDLLWVLAKLSIQPLFLFGALNFVMANVLWMLIIATQPLSIAYPMQISLIIVFNAMMSFCFFSERLTTTGVIGLACVLLGVILMRAEAAP